jgi:hypothetical protein
MPDTAGLGDLWIRASRLTETCAITVHVVGVPPGWKVRVALHRDPDTHTDGAGEHVLEALALAVNRAESMGLAPASIVPRLD